MPKTSIFAKFTAAPGKRDELLAALRPLLESVESEPGTEVYAMNTAGEDDVWFYEVYSDDDAFKAHSGSEALKAAFAKTADLAAGRPEIMIGQLQAGKGVTA